MSLSIAKVLRRGAPAALALLVAGGAHAQPQPQPQPQEDQGVVWNDYAAAQDQPVDGRRLAMARELISQMRLDDNIRTALAEGARAMPSVMGRGSGERTREALADFTGRLDAVLPELMDADAEISAQIYSQAELEGALAFYRGPAGQAIARESPEVRRQMWSSVVRVVANMTTQVARDFCRHEACPEGVKANMKRLSDSMLEGGGATAPLGPVDPVRLALARRILARTESEAAIKAAMSSLPDMRPPKSGDPAVDAKIRKLADIVQAAMTSAMIDLREAQVQAHARVFSVEELQAILAYYDSPAGRSMLDKAPAVQAALKPVLIRLLARSSDGDDLASLASVAGEPVAFTPSPF